MVNPKVSPALGTREAQAKEAMMSRGSCALKHPA
jgi:hypothetical protein